MRTNNLFPSITTRPVPSWVPELAQTSPSPDHQVAGFFVSEADPEHPTRDQVREQLGWNLIPTNTGAKPSR